MTILRDTLIIADGTPAQGYFTLTWPMFQLGQLPIAGGQKTYELVDGQINISLTPTTNAQP